MEHDLLDGVAEIPLCCSSGALLLICIPSPGSGHLLLALASNWTGRGERDGLRFLSLGSFSLNPSSLLAKLMRKDVLPFL